MTMLWWPGQPRSQPQPLSFRWTCSYCFRPGTTIWLSSTKTNQHQPVNEMFVQVDGAHHAPVDVAISACDWGGVRLEEHHHHYCHPHCHCHCYWGWVHLRTSSLLIWWRWWLTSTFHNHGTWHHDMFWHVLSSSIGLDSHQRWWLNSRQRTQHRRT